jgi:aspartyl-tRNA(Asn)/glutamyl-tRNA(Gln) amidotransferase subunit A
MSELFSRSAAGLRQLLEAQEVSAAEVLESHLGRIEAAEPHVHAFMTVMAAAARRQAAGIDRRRTAGEELGALAGIPVAVKDVLCTKGTTTTCSSRILADFVPPYDATVVERLYAADAVVVGKTNMDEFAMGSSTENSAFGPTMNPWDLGRVPGGYSGGSAAAVAARQAPVSVGTDTGGSIRQPAALCGLVGIKPTYGVVSRYGLIAFASSLDQAGTFGRDVSDATHALTAIAGHDPRDSTSIPEDPPDMLTGLEEGVDGLRIGVVGEYMAPGGVGDVGMQPAVRARVEEAIERLSALGADIVEVSLPSTAKALNAYYLIAPSEASSNLSRYDGVRYGLRVDGATTEEMMAATRAAGFGPEVQRRIMIGTYALSAGYYDAYYVQAQRVRTLVISEFAAAYERCDVLVGPTSPTTAFALGELTADPIAMYLNDVYAVPSSLAGAPALSMPVGLDDTGLPVGFQVMAPLLREDLMVRTARALEADLGFDPRPSGAASLDAVMAGMPGTGTEEISA